MRRSVRVYADIGPEERLAKAIAGMPPSAQRALVTIADREDLPLVAGSWQQGDGGCLVSNVVRALGVTPDDARTVDLRVLDLLPEMSSRDLNRLVVAWDEAAMQERRATDPTLRRMLRGALVRAGVPPTMEAYRSTPTEARVHVDRNGLGGTAGDSSPSGGVAVS